MNRRIDEELLAQMGVQLERGGLAKVHVTETDSVSDSLDAQIDAIRKGIITVQVQKYFHFNSLNFAANRLLEKCNDGAEAIELLPVVFLQAATIECLVNDLTIDWCGNNFKGDSARMAEAFLDGSLRSKLFRLVPLYTESKMILKIDDPTVQSGLKLISLRNKLIHITESYREPTAPGAGAKPSVLSALTYDDVVSFQRGVSEMINALWNVLHRAGPWVHPMFISAIK